MQYRRAMQFLTDFADQGVILPVALMALLAFAVLRWWRGAAVWIVVLGATLGLVLLLKIGFRTCGGGTPGSRPFNPSGHVASVTAVYGGLAAVMLGQHGAALLPAVLIAALIAVTRLALGVHTVADVVTGGVIGLVAVAALCRFAGPLPSARRWQTALLAVVVAALLHGAHLDAEGAIRDLAARLRPTMGCSRL